MKLFVTNLNVTVHLYVNDLILFVAQWLFFSIVSIIH